MLETEVYNIVSGKLITQPNLYYTIDDLFLRVSEALARCVPFADRQQQRPPGAVLQALAQALARMVRNNQVRLVISQENQAQPLYILRQPQALPRVADVDAGAIKRARDHVLRMLAANPQNFVPLSLLVPKDEPSLEMVRAIAQTLRVFAEENRIIMRIDSSWGHVVYKLRPRT